ncbi:MAG TPA: hypothetical protein VHW04_03145 [Solirubrobacteraceae bacterium]|nr:hypothetical protein [Solirubrobacteraceae bacterium]
MCVSVAVLAASVLFVVIVGMRPSYDPYGWLVWGRQVLHWNLNTDGAPSWKPLTFLFTLPYALFGRAAPWLWMVTSVVGTLAGAVFATRIAYRLTQAGGVPATRRYAPYLAGAFAGIGLLGMQTYPHLILIANSDQLNVALCLAAIDAHLSRRPRLAFAMVVSAALGRPEVWPFAVLYAGWLWLRVPEARSWAVLGLAVIPLTWFSVPALTSKSIFHAGDLALNQVTVIHGNKVIGVIQRWRSLYELPMQLAAALGVVLAAVRRDLETLGLAAVAVLWVVIEVAFAYHGWSAVSRYMIEPAAVMIVIAGGLVGRLLADGPGWATVVTGLASAGRWVGPALRMLGPALVIVLLVSLLPAAHHRARVWRDGISEARADAKVIKRLGDVIAKVGGASAVLRCGQPVSYNRFQSTLAWAVGLNVGATGYNVGKSISRGKPIVTFTVHRDGWQVRPYNLLPQTAASCRRLRADSAMG